jgi:D-glycero-D-manno-heptose 1,7-bisphosphate phosphatase
MHRGALFLDRDGAINVDHGYVHQAEQFVVPGIFDLTRYAANEMHWLIVVITNQSGIGRGYFDEVAFQDLTRWMCSRFEPENAPIARVYYCPFHPEYGIGEYRLDHPWRKPKPGMILQAATDLGLDLAASAIIGDSLSDMQAGAAAGVGLRIRIGRRDLCFGINAPSHQIASDVAEALALLRSHRVTAKFDRTAT